MSSTRSALVAELQMRQEMWRRECRADLLSWCIEALAPQGLTPASHHKLLIAELEAVARGECQRLMIFMPPGSAKSTYVSKLFPAWLMTRGGLKVIGASHTTTLAEEFSGDVRRLILSNAPTLGYSLANDRADRWKTTNRCEYLAAGVGVGIAGFRGDIAVIDDPVKSREAADSQAIRDKTWKWFQADLGPRLTPHASVILMHTRWHEDDLAGRLLDSQGAKWRVLKLPALADSEDDPLGRPLGAPLWDDDAYGYGNELIGKRDDYDSDGSTREWASLYQQSPRPQDGAIFQPSHMDVLDIIPRLNHPVRAWDLAATAQVGTRNPDYTVGLKLGRLADGRIAVTDVKRARGGPQFVQDLIVQTAKEDGKDVRISLPQDPGQAGKAQTMWLIGALEGYHVFSSPETGDKATRAGPAASQVNAGRVVILRAPWNMAFKDELAAFPSGAKDDQVDAFSRAMAHIMMHRPVAMVAPIVVFTPRNLDPAA